MGSRLLDAKSILKRMEGLERENRRLNRRLRWIGIVFSVIVLAIFAVGTVVSRDVPKKAAVVQPAD